MGADPHIPYEAMTRYLGGICEADERESIDRHLADCEFCRRDMEDARNWATAVAALPGEPQKKTFTWIAAAIALPIFAALAYFFWWRFA